MGTYACAKAAAHHPQAQACQPRHVLARVDCALCAGRGWDVSLQPLVLGLIMHIKTTFNAGIGFNKVGESMDPDQVTTMALPAIRARLALEYGGFTESSVIGGWNDGTTVITEQGLQWVCLSEGTVPDAIHHARTVAQMIAGALDQASVLASVEELHFQFVTQAGEVADA